MCRHLAYLGPAVPLARLLTEPPGGLYEQAWRPRRQQHGTVNADGFGFGWYPPDERDEPDEPHEPGAAHGTGHRDGPAGARGEEPAAVGFPQPARYRRAIPMWADANVADLVRTVRSGAVLAAVRSATEGTAREESAAAPFRDGRWLFSHNGAVADWTRLPAALAAAAEAAGDARRAAVSPGGPETAGPRAMYPPAGPAHTPPGVPTAEQLLTMEAASDSALLWAMIAARLRRGEPPGGALAAVVREVAAVRPTARLNLLLTDGRTIAATAWGDTLWYRTGLGQVCVASEPDDAPGQWHEVPDRSLLLATAAGGVRTTALRPRHTDSTDSKDSKDISLMTQSRFTLDDRLPAGYFTDTLRADVAAGLGANPRTLPPKWFYDKRGSDLFERITELPEYYPTRTEHEILQQRAPEIAELTRAATLVELGSGSSRKTRLLLDALTARGTLLRYAPLDVSGSALHEAGQAICRDYPGLRVAATVADFESGLELSDEPGPRLLAFLGSTIGNLDADQRRGFYGTLSRALSGDDVLLLGADLVKDPDVLVRAYDDAAGVTAQFDKNVLLVMNRELGADFDPDAFAHVAVWNADEERIEMRLRALHAHTVKVPDLDLTVDFAEGEDLRTELSCKFRRASLTAELHDGGFTVRHWWTDAAERFALLLAVPR